MDTTITPKQVPLSAAEVADSDVLLDIEGIMARYGCGRTKAYEQIAVPGFPRSVMKNMVRIPLVAIRAWELRYSLDAVESEEVPAPTPLAPPPARRAGRPTKAVA